MNPFPVLAVHGGAGTISKALMSDEKRSLYEKGLEAALMAGYKILESGGSAVDAVIAAVSELEDNPLFNAGKGAVLSHEGQYELDASIMSGNDRAAGAVASVQGVKNPIKLANAIMLNSSHVLLTGIGAKEFAESQDIEFVDADYYRTEARVKQWEVARKTGKTVLDHSGESEVGLLDEKKFGTVGAVAIDLNGELAAGTSTGGMTNKKFGRVGDSPIIGCGTFADKDTCAISCTGDGEFFMRGVAAYDVHALMKYAHLALPGACRKVIHEHVLDLGGEGGLIAVDKEGNISFPFNSAGMYRGYINSDKMVTGIFKGETPGVE